MLPIPGRSWLVAALSLSAGVVAAYAYAAETGLSPDAGLRPGMSDGRAALADAASLGGVLTTDGVQPHSFYFSRAAYGGGPFGLWSSWSVDFPKADQQFLTVLRRLTGIDASPDEHPIRLDDPELRRFPFLYAVEVGSMGLSDAEVEGLRSYLLAGGFLMVDDFWGSREWAAFEQQILRVLPEFEIVDIPMDHEVFSTFYQIDEILQVPNVGQGMSGGATHERDGYVPRCLGIFDEKGRLMVVINWNTDLGDAWEWAEQARYPLRFSTFAYQMGANFIVYAMTR